MKPKLPRTYKALEALIEGTRHAAYDSGYTDGKRVGITESRNRIAYLEQQEQQGKQKAMSALCRLADQLASTAEGLSKALMSNARQL